MQPGGRRRGDSSRPVLAFAVKTGLNLPATGHDMCGRYILTSAPEAVRALFNYAEHPNFPPRYNIAPTQPVVVVTGAAGLRSFALMRWGFLPSWVKDPADFPLLVNARAETLLDKPAFRAAIRHRRCLVPANGYYEWQAGGRGKQPFLVTPRDGGPLAFAGVFETWCGPNGEEIDTVAVITVDASPVLSALHARMPAIIARENFDAWLDCKDTDVHEAARLLASAPDDTLDIRPVAPTVNRADREGADLIAPYELPVEPESKKKAHPPAAKRTAPARSGKTRRESGQGSLF